MQDSTYLSAADLDLVTGGTAHASPSSTTNDQLLAAMQGLQSSLKDLTCNNNNNSLFGGNNALLFMTMAMCMSRRNDVYVYGGGRCGGWYSWRAGW